MDPIQDIQQNNEENKEEGNEEKKEVKKEESSNCFMKLQFSDHDQLMQFKKKFEELMEIETD